MGADREPFDDVMMPAESPRVSVLMTAYNRAAFIGEAIESVLAQTFTDFELVVVDDRSTDATVAIARRYERDPRVRIVENEHNLGDYPNRNRAAGFARGTLLKYHDSDDVMYGHCLQVMVDALESAPDADFALSGSREWPGAASPMLLTPALAYEREFLGSGLFQLGPACALFRAPFFRSLGGFDSAGAASDYLFWFKACARGRALLCPGDLFYYRHHDGQELSSPRSAGDYARARGRAWAALNSPECPLAGEALEQAKRNFVFTILREVWRHARSGAFGKAAFVARCAGLTPGMWLRYARPPRRVADAGTPRRADSMPARAARHSAAASR
jgi:GT2 family glycosyltransferase